MSTKKTADKKPITVMVPESLARKAKIMAELEGKSLSELVEENLATLVKRRLPKLLDGIMDPETVVEEVPVAAE